MHFGADSRGLRPCSTRLQTLGLPNACGFHYRPADQALVGWDLGSLLTHWVAIDNFRYISLEIPPFQVFGLNLARFNRNPLARMAEFDGLGRAMLCHSCGMRALPGIWHGGRTQNPLAQLDHAPLWTLARCSAHPAHGWHCVNLAKTGCGPSVLRLRLNRPPNRPRRLVYNNEGFAPQNLPVSRDNRRGQRPAPSAG